MITYSIIQKSQLEGGLWLDAEYYHEAQKIIARRQVKSLLEEAKQRVEKLIEK